MLTTRTENQTTDIPQYSDTNNLTNTNGTGNSVDTLTLVSDTLQLSSDSLVVDSLKETAIELPQIVRKEGTQRIQHKVDSWVFVVLFLGFALFAWVRIIFNKYLNHLLQALLNFTTTARMYRERVYKIMHASFCLDVLFVTMFSLSLYLINSYFKILDLTTSNFISYLVIIIFVTLYLLSRQAVYRLLGFVFGHQTEVKEYLFDNAIVLRNASMLLLPLNTFLSFVNFEPRQALLIYSISNLLIPTTIVIRGFIVMLKKHISFFYLILYLCTLEILPLLLICKIIENYGNG